MKYFGATRIRSFYLESTRTVELEFQTMIKWLKDFSWTQEIFSTQLLVSSNSTAVFNDRCSESKYEIWDLFGSYFQQGTNTQFWAG